MTATFDIRYSYRDVPTVKAFSESDAFIRGLMGPFGSGKSSGCVIECYKRSAMQPVGPDGVIRARGAIIRNTYQQLRDTTIKTFHEWFPPHLFGHWRSSDHTYHMVMTAPDGTPMEVEVLFRALDRPDQLSNLLSLELTWAWVNEAREVPWTIIEALQGRVGRYPAKKSGGAAWWGIFMDTNPPDEGSWWFRLFEENPQDNAAIFKQPSGLSGEAENLSNLPPDYYGNLEKGKDPEFIKVYIDGQYGFVQDGKPVFPEYNDNIHCKEVQPIPGKPIRRGWDFGLTPSCTFSQLLPNGQWIIFDEMCAESMGIERFADDVLLHCAREYPDYSFEDYGDPAGQQRAQTDEKTCFEILRAKGVKIDAGEQSEAIRLESIRKPLNTMISGQPAFRIHPRCKMLRKGFMGGYRFRRMQTSAERYTDKPEKNEYSHPMDALQYDATRLFGPAIRGRKEQKPKPIKINTSYVV